MQYLIASCLDFAEELTALQHVGKELGVSVIITPKFHAEMTGEGIEYNGEWQRVFIATSHWNLKKERQVSRR